MDFAPTVLSLAGVKIPDYMQSQAFAGPARPTTAAREVPVFITRDRMDERYDMMRMVSDGRFFYVRNAQSPRITDLAEMLRAWPEKES